MNLKVYIDGGARGNPGHAGIGVVVIDESGKVVEEIKKYIGHATNNIAEYEALIAGLEAAKKYKPSCLFVYTDSELVCKQMQGLYRVKNEGLLRYYGIAQSAVSGFQKVQFFSIPREQNKHADKLVNQALDTASAMNYK